MEFFNGVYTGLCEDEHTLKVEYDKSSNEFYGYCTKCGWTPEPIKGDDIDDLFI